MKTRNLMRLFAPPFTSIVTLTNLSNFSVAHLISGKIYLATELLRELNELMFMRST